MFGNGNSTLGAPIACKHFAFRNVSSVKVILVEYRSKDVQVGEEKEGVYINGLNAELVFNDDGGQLRRYEAYSPSLMNGDHTVWTLLLLEERI